MGEREEKKRMNLKEAFVKHMADSCSGDGKTMIQAKREQCSSGGQNADSFNLVQHWQEMAATELERLAL